MPPLEAARSGSRRVLIVDDDEPIVKMLTKFFTELGGYEIIAAADGLDAGVQVARFHPDLVLLDIEIPQMDGIAVCRKIKADPATRNAQVLIMTGFGTPEHRKAVATCGADGFIAKPFALPALKRWVREHVRDGGAR